MFKVLFENTDRTFEDVFSVCLKSINRVGIFPGVGCFLI